MALLPPYTIGLATVAYGGTSVSIPGAILTDVEALELDLFVDAATNMAALIRVVPDTTHVTIDPWPGFNLSAASYRIEKTSPLRFSSGRVYAEVEKLLATLNGKTFYKVLGDEPDPELGEEDQEALKTNAGAWKLWRKTGGVWVLQGAPAGLTYRNEWNGATPYVVNDRVSRNGQSFTAKQANTNHDPATDSTFVYWDGGGVKGDAGNNGLSMRGGSGAPSNALGVDGDRYFRTDTADVYVKAAGAWSIEASVKGATGATPVISGTSTSVVAVALGPLNFAVQTGLPLIHGQRLRFANADLSRVVAGSIDTYNPATGAIAFVSDFKIGTGADNNWTFSTTGELGIGSSGPPGTASSVPGPPGSPGAASIVPGPKGEDGATFSYNQTGNLAQRALWDNQPQNFAFLETDTAPFRLWVKASNTSGDWAGPTFIGGQAAVGDMGLITDSVLDSYDYGSIAA